MRYIDPNSGAAPQPGAAGVPMTKAQAHSQSEHTGGIRYAMDLDFQDEGSDVTETEQEEALSGAGLRQATAGEGDGGATDQDSEDEEQEATSGSEDTVDGEKSLDEMNKTELTDLAREREISGFSTMNRDELIKALS